MAKSSVGCALVILCSAAVSSGVAVAQAPLRTTVSTGGRIVVIGTREPVADATVLLVRRAYPGLPDTLYAHMPLEAREQPRTKTDARGRFSFRIPVGEIVAFFAQKGGVMSLVSKPVTAGGFVELDLRPTRVVSGKFVRVGEDSKPVVGQEVHVYVPAGEDYTRGMRLVTKTDSKGRYKVTVPLGTWVRVQAQGDGWYVSRDVHENVINDFDVGRRAQWLSGKLVHRTGAPMVGIVVADHHTPRVRSVTNEKGEFFLNTGRSKVNVFVPENHAMQWTGIRGARVLRPAARGNRIRFRLVDGGGDPLRDMRVVVIGISEHARRTRELFVVPRIYRTDGEGRLTVHASRQCEFLAAFVEVGGRFAWFFRGAPKSAGDVGDLTISPTCRLAGQIRGADRLPVGNRAIHLVRLPDDGAVLLPQRLARHVKNLPLTLTCESGSGGRFLFPQVQEGRYVLVVHADGHLPFAKEVRVAGTNEFLRIQMPKGRTVSGCVLHASGSPIAGARVFLNPAYTPAQAKEFMTKRLRWIQTRFSMSAVATADAKGRYRFVGLPAINVNLVAVQRGVGQTTRHLATKQSWDGVDFSIRKHGRK